MDKETELKRSKARALALLGLSALVFAITAWLPPGFAVGWIKAIAEAAMVGALADWFAVVALFRRVPIPLVSRHTAIIPAHKDEIADNLAAFVKDRFLDDASLVGLIRKHDPAQRATDWLQSPDHAARLGTYATRLLGGALAVMDDERIQGFVRAAVRTAIGKVDWSRTAGIALESLTRGGRHQELLDAGIEQLLALLRQPQTQAFIAARIVEWLKREHPLKEKVLPSEWIGANGSELIADALRSVLDQVGNDRGHVLRQRFDEAAARLVERLKHDPAFLERAEAIQRYVQDDAAFNAYVGQLWDELRGWLRQDLERDDSLLRARVQEAAGWLGGALAQDPALRASLNGRLEEAARAMAPEFAQFLTRHIRDTVRNWDAAEMSRLIELHIGKDLQRIRVNGTVVGAMVGCVLYLLSHAAELWRMAG
ncbi:hypothetical protein BKK79_10400 [Cupriavidus sp. USMAA2-4]|uniref:DUF445 domain-containing protein n=1 Tax=Cupriavidus sp. USMAA2-4 TaxID=876364 RepID=UPI0008A6D1CE|nr:DUF445 family protein [Cupriavidus sp. USMAA2-4]AOY92152.1 hypothetical protein BKK79_10400 [Cupriavidus sp. USMAA2-4]